MSTAGKVLGLIRRGVLVGAKLTSGALRQLQAKVDGTTVDDVELFEPYGLAAVAPAGADVLLVHVGGDEAHPVAIAASHRSHRPSGLTSGQVAIYDASGKVVLLSSGGILLGGSGATKSVARAGDPVEVSQAAFVTWIGQVQTAVNALTPGAVTPFVGSPTGTITSGSATVKAVD